VFEERHVLDLDGTEVQIIYVGPCHQTGDTIIHVPKEGVVFAGDVLFRECTPMGWNGTFEKWMKVLDLIISLKPKVVVPGHGPVCGIEGVKEMKAYLEYVRAESKRCFGQGLTSFEASSRLISDRIAGGAPGTPVHERRARLPGVPPRGRGRTWNHAKTFDLFTK